MFQFSQNVVLKRWSLPNCVKVLVKTTKMRTYPLCRKYCHFDSGQRTCWRWLCQAGILLTLIPMYSYFWHHPTAIDVANVALTHASNISSSLRFSFWRSQRSCWKYVTSNFPLHDLVAGYVDAYICCFFLFFFELHVIDLARKSRVDTWSERGSQVL